jgi:hypothetical protein
MKGKDMNDRQKRLRTRFEPDTRFEVAAAPFRIAAPTELEKLKDRLLPQLLEQARQPEQNVLLRRAANVAVALAWATPYPVLLFPALLEEKAAEALVQYRRQERIRQQSVTLALQVA